MAGGFLVLPGEVSKDCNHSQLNKPLSEKLKVCMTKINGYVFYALAFVVLAANSSVAFARSENQWQPDQRVPGYLDDTFTPYLVADRNRTVHAFASQRVNNEVFDRAIFYRQWSLAGGWTIPVDILFLPQGDTQIQGAFLDKTGMMHIIFWGGSPRDAHIYYSTAPVVDVGRSSAWSTPIIIGEKAGGTSSAYLAGDERGNLVVAYSGLRDGNGVYATHSKDDGKTWTKPQPVFLTYDSNLVPFSLRLFLGKSNQIRAAWNVVTSRGTDISLHFANFDLNKSEWSEPITLNTRVEKLDNFGPSFPSMVDNGEEVIIMYNNGNPFTGRPVGPGRPVQMVSVSDDGGSTWNVPVVPFFRHVGRSGEHTLALDSNNVTHALFVQRIEETVNNEYRAISGVYHSAYKDGLWSDPDRFITTYAPHDVRAVVSQGNVLLVVWRQDPGAEKVHGVWYSYAILDTPELSVLPIPMQSSTPDISITSSVDPSLVSETPSEAPNVDLSNRSFGLAGNPAGSLLVAVLIVILLLASVIVIYSLNRNRENNQP